MTDWKPGDKFKLECEGEIRDLGRGRKTVGGPMEDEVSIVIDDEGYFPVGRKWFDAHATKIQRSLQFADQVQLGNQKGVVVNPKPAEQLVRVWFDGEDHARILSPERLTLIDSAKDE